MTRPAFNRIGPAGHRGDPWPRRNSAAYDSRVAEVWCNRSINGSGLVAAEAVTEPINEELTESAILFGNSLITAMEAATQSEAMTNFTAAFNTGIKDAVFPGVIDSFLASGFVDQMLAPIRGAITQAVEAGKGGQVLFPDVTATIQQVSATAAAFEPLIAFLQQLAFGIRGALG